MRKKETFKIKTFKMVRYLFLLSALAWVFAHLTGCAALPDIKDTALGNANQKTDSGPLYKYRADLKISFPGNPNTYNGVIPIKMTARWQDVVIDSLVSIDRIQVTTCARQDVCEKDGDCPSKMFVLEDGWFGQAGKKATYRYAPSKKEKEGPLCPLYIEVLSKQSLVSWGMIAFRTDENLPAFVSCNGVDTDFSGVTLCQSKGGLEQTVEFSKDILDFEAEKSCNVKQKDKRSFDFKPANGLCRATFYDGKDWHRAMFIGYEQVLVRGN